MEDFVFGVFLIWILNNWIWKAKKKYPTECEKQVYQNNSDPVTHEICTEEKQK